MMTADSTLVAKVRAPLAGRPLAELTNFEQNVLGLISRFEEQDAKIVSAVAEVRATKALLLDAIDRIVNAAIRG